MKNINKVLLACISLAFLLACQNSNKCDVIRGNYALKIQNKIWMSRNLSVSQFRNGDMIYEAVNMKDWKWASDNEKPARFYSCGFGYLYNYSAIKDPRGLIPKHWRSPTEEDVKSLIEYHGGAKIAGKNLKSHTGWARYFTFLSGNGNNKYCFNALPTGSITGGRLNDKGEFAVLYIDPVSALVLTNDWDKTYIDNFFWADNADGIAVRCVTDEATYYKYKLNESYPILDMKNLEEYYKALNDKNSTIIHFN